MAVKAVRNLMFEKNLFKSEIGLHGFRGSNEITKTFKFDLEKVKVKFDVIVRIKEAFSGKEMCEKATEKTVLDKIFQTFTEYQSSAKPIE